MYSPTPAPQNPHSSKTHQALEKVEAFAAISPTLLHLENSRTKLAAGTLVASGCLCVAHGTRRYFATMKLLQRGLFQPNVSGVALVAATSVGIGFAGALLLLENEGRHGKGPSAEVER